MTERNDKEPSLHDWLALGELEVALAPEKRQNKDDLDARRKDEIRRLPLLLRMLSASQPLSSIPSITQSSVSVSSEEGASADPLVDQVVSRLEDVAAMHSVAEGVDALTSYHAPLICRKMSRLPPLKRDKRKLEWNTQDLASVAASPLGPPRKKRRHQLEGLAPVPSGDAAMEVNVAVAISGDDDMSVDEGKEDPLDSMVPNSSDGGEANAASSDSQEATTTKSLTEIAKLVVASLEPITENKEDEEGCSSLLLSVMTGALLSEPASDLNSAGSAGAVGGCDLGATFSALMHHTPVLRHRHVATALCRAAAPQAVVLIGRMGANCPSAVPCLLRGCIDAFVAATNDDVRAHAVIANTAKAGVRSLANLSHRECIRARSVLRQSNVMVDVQLELAIREDPIAAACLLNKHLSDYAVGAQKEAPMNVGTPSDTLSEKDTLQPTSSAADHSKTISLKQLLEDNPELLRNSFTCILDALADSSGPSGSRMLSGRIIVLLRALSFLLLFGGAWKRGSAGNIFTSDVIENACKDLVVLQRDVFKGASDTSERVAPRSENDNVFRYLVCACLSMYARVTYTSEDSGAVRALTEKCLKCAFDVRSISLQSDVFSSSVASMLKACNCLNLCSLILETLTDRSCVSFCYKILKEGLLKTCKTACSLPNLDSIIEKGTSDAAAMEDPSALIEYNIAEGWNDRVDQFIRCVLNDPTRSSKLLNSNESCLLIQFAVTGITTNEGTAIPCVLPVQLQTLSFKIDWRKGSTRLSQPPLECQYLLQLLYCLYFLEEEPKSPFAIDPRDFPLKESLELAKLLLEQHRGITTIESELKSLIEKMAPEVSCQIDMSLVHLATNSEKAVRPNTSIQSIRHARCDKLTNSIRECKRDTSNDPSGYLVEEAFVYASHQLTSSDLVVTAVRALVGPPNMPLPFMTYSGLCRDPLVLLKAPLTVWRCRGLRRIALVSLSSLLQANDNIIASASASEGVASELLMSRDAIIVKCLIMASVGGGIGKDCLRPFTDSMLVATVRGMVAKHVGLVAQLVKEGRNDIIVDWFVDFVPESLQDADSLTMLLSERSSLTAAEKLETASAALRIAIAHEGRNESAAKTLTYAALTRLVSSFFLVIGPVGVPVNALDAEDGTDVTQVCRNATFRMLSALQNVRGSRGGILDECGLALQKLANLCKGESIMAGVPGAVAGLRKKVLKDIYDAVTKAANSMGTGIKL